MDCMVEVSRARFEELVEDALDRVPEPLLRALDNVVVQVEDENVDEPHLLGLYSGIDLTRRSHEYSFALPDADHDLPAAAASACAPPRTSWPARSRSPSCTSSVTTSASTTIGCTSSAGAERPAPNRQARRRLPWQP